MSKNNRKKTRRLLKAVLGIGMSVAIIGTSVTGAYAKDYEYPYSSKFPNGIEDTDISVFTESEIKYPLNMNWETNGEIEAVKSNSSDGQISLSEDAYEGKFSLCIKPESNDKILINETDEYSVGNSMVEPSTYSLRSTNVQGGINISVSDKRITVSGVADAPKKEISILVLDADGSIAYINQATSGDDGAFEFNFNLDKYSTYTVKVRNASSSPFEQTLILDGNSYDKTITDTSVKSPESIDTKANIIKLWIKPKYKAENISFYVTAVCDGEEKQLCVLGDKDNDGIFKVSKDLALGKWQQISLDLLKLEEVTDSTMLKNLYVSANEGSEWVIDCISSDYREIDMNYVDLEQFAGDNIEYNDNGELIFSTNENGEYSNSSKIVTGQIDLNGDVSSVSVDAEFMKRTDGNINLGSKADKVTYYTIPGYTSGVFSGDKKKIFYNNSLDNNYIYCFDTTNYTSTKVVEISDSIRGVSYTGNRILFDNGVYDTETGEFIPLYGGYTNNYLSPSGDIFAIKRRTDTDYYHLGYKYSDGAYTLFYDYDCYNICVTDMAFSNFSNIFAIRSYNYWDIYENTDTGCKHIKSLHSNSNSSIMYNFISNDGTKLFYYDYRNDKAYMTDIATGVTTISTREVCIGQATDGRYIIWTPSGELTDRYLYDEIKGTKEYLYGIKGEYCSERNQFLSVDNGILKVTDLNMNTEYNKYLLSFDGKKTWYAYDDGNWVTASSSPVPSITEMKNNGMTKEEINAIPEEAYSKIYKNGNEVYTLNFAIGMFGSTSYITPVVKSIAVNTIADEPVDSIYSSKLFSYEKSKYNKINGIFPIESFPKISECYYLLYLGNDWLYTYKDGKILKIDAKSDELLSDISASWMTIKQKGLSASEVRNIPNEVLTELFVSEEFANNKFGIIAVSKIKDKSTVNYTVDVKLSAEDKYVSEDGYVLEISLSGSDKLILTPEDITKAEIDNFLNWVEKRPNGEAFYKLKTADGQRFVNYYGITNISVYKQKNAIANVE